MRPLVAIALCASCTGPSGDDGTSDTQACGAAVEVSATAFGTPRQPLAFDVTVSDETERLVWTWGDGEVDRTDAGAAPVEHTYDGPGHYRASVEALGCEGASDVGFVDVTIAWPVLDPAPRRSSSTVADDRRIFVAMPDFGAVAVVDAASGAVDHLEPCAVPRRLSLLPDATGAGVLAVACDTVEPAVVVYDVDAAGVPDERWRATLSGSGLSPFGVLLTDDGQVWATMRSRETSQGQIKVWRADGSPDRQPGLGPDLRGLAGGGAVVLATRHRSPDDGGRWFRILLPDWIVESEVVPHAPGPDSDTGSRGVPTYLEPVAMRPDGRAAVLAGLRANIDRGLVRDGRSFTHDTTVRADLRLMSLATTEGTIGAQIRTARLDDRDLVSAVAFHPRGDWLYAATLGSQTIEVLDAYSLRLAGVFHDLGPGVDGLAVSPDGTRLYAHARYARELVTLSLPDGAEVERIDLRPGGEEVFTPEVLAGAVVFHTSSDPRMSQDGYASCASCHLDGEDDGRVWDFTDRGEGLRNTISLRGMDQRAGLPIHWTGNFDEVQDFEHDIRGPQAGAGFLPQADWEGPAGTTLGAPKAGLSPELDALAAYSESLGLLDVPWFPDVDAGRALFEDEVVGCADCHPSGGSTSGWLGPGVPDLVDVGTLGPDSGQRLGAPLDGLDVPDLRGVWATPPYLHDGSAPTLRDVLTTSNPGDEHGTTSHLDDDQLDALERYLRSL